MCWYQQCNFLASSLRRISFVGKSLCIPAPGLMILATFIFLASCREPFDPQLTPQQTDYLVVEGFINANGVTSIKLSRTLPLKDSVAFKTEADAKLEILGDDNSTYLLTQTGAGIYLSAALNLNESVKYRLHIMTTDGNEYISASASVRKTPPIDNISWKVEDNKVQLYVNTHDSQNNTHYYKWDYEETWEIHSAFSADYKYENGSVSTREISEIPKLFYCWQNQTSTSLLFGSSVQLASDVISEAPLLSIPFGSTKISVRYSILVKQYSIDKDAYEFYRLMKRNTESIGSIFDLSPSDLTGNIVCVNNPRQKVIGYITTSTVEEKRLFIKKDEIPAPYYSHNCDITLVPNNVDSFKLYYESFGLLPYQAKGTPPRIEGYYSSVPECIDCRLLGTNIKPDFW